VDHRGDSNLCVGLGFLCALLRNCTAVRRGRATFDESDLDSEPIVLYSQKRLKYQLPL
jgi:hypothetical protein